MLGLGDSSYATYQGNPRQINEALQALGAKPLAKITEADEQGSEEAQIAKFTEDLWPLVTPLLGGESKDSPKRPVSILFASKSGTTQVLAEEIDESLTKAGFMSEIHELNAFEKAGFLEPSEKVWLILTPTVDEGDTPDNGKVFSEWLSNHKGSLAHLRYSLLGIGDSYHADTFNATSKRFQTQLESLGANCLEFVRADRGSSFFDESAQKWQKRTLQAI